MRSFILAFLLIICSGAATVPGAPGGLRAQIPTTPAFAKMAERMGVKIIQPLAGTFRLEEIEENDYLEDRLRVYSKAEKLEMRFAFRAVPAGDIYAGMPHLLAGTLAANLGSNDEDAVTSIHSFGEEELSVFNADWAAMYTFRPKRSYSERANAQLVAIYRGDRGMAYTVLLFDKAPGTLDDRQLSLSFSNDAKGN